MNKQEQKEAFDVVINQHKGILVTVSRAYCRDETDRQDLMQEILVQVWQSLPKYNVQFRMSTWLYRIAINVAISFYRKQSTRKKEFVSPDDQPLEKYQEKEQQLLLLEKFISELKDLDKALMLLYLEEKTHAEIAEILGISVSNVSTKTARIREKLRLRFSPFKNE